MIMLFMYKMSYNMSVIYFNSDHHHIHTLYHHYSASCFWLNQTAFHRVENNTFLVLVFYPFFLMKRKCKALGHDPGI